MTQQSNTLVVAIYAMNEAAESAGTKQTETKNEDERKILRFVTGLNQINSFKKSFIE